MHNETSVRLLSRPGCHLCADAAAMLRRIVTALGTDFQIVDITGHPDLERQYGEVIPVVFVGDDEVARAPISEPALRDAVRRRLGR